MSATPIAPVGGVGPLAGKNPLTPATSSDATGFKDLLGKYINDVNTMQSSADKSVRDLATGNMNNLHQVIVAINEADLSFQLMMQVRNRLVDAYKEVMRMQI